MPGENAEQGQGDRRHDHERDPEVVELPYDEEVDPEHRGDEGGAHVAEGHIGDLPLAVPEQGRLRFVERLAVVADLGRTERPPVVARLDPFHDLDHAVDGRFETPRELAHDHVGEMGVLAEQGQRGALARNRDDIAELHVARADARRAARGERCREQPFGDLPPLLRQPHDDLHRIGAAAAVRVADDHAGAEQGLDRVVDRLLLDAVELEIGLIDPDPQAFRRHPEAVVDVDDEVDLLEDLPQLARIGPPRRGIGPVDLGEKRREHGRARRHLHHLDGRALRHRHAGEPLAHLERDRVARARAFVLGDEVDREITELGAPADVIVAHEAVEVEGRRRPGIGLDGPQFGQIRDRPGEIEENALRLLERAALGQIDDDLEFGLVVEGEKLDGHRLRVEEREGGDHPGADDKEEEQRAAAGAIEEGRHAQIEAPHAVEPLFARRLRTGLPARPAQFHPHPGRDDDRDEEAEQHRRRGIDRDRGHVRPHEPGDEEHRQESGDDRQGGDDRGIAHFGHGPDRHPDRVRLRLHPPVAGDVLDEDDGVVDENTDREDEREQTDPVDRVAEHPGGEEGEENGDRDGPEYDPGLAEAHEDGDDDDDRDRREEEVEEQLVGLVRRRLAVVARDLDPDILGDQPPVQRLEPLEQLLRHHHRIRPLALGDRDRHRGQGLEMAALTRKQRPHAIERLAAAHHHIGDVLDVDRPPVTGGDEQKTDVGHAAQRLTAEDLDAAPALAQPSHEKLAVGVAHLGDQLFEGHAEKRHALGVRLDADLIRPAADDEGEAHLLGLDELMQQLLGDVVERVVRPAGLHGFRKVGAGGEGEREDRHVVDAALDDQGFGNAHRDAVEVRAQPLMDAEDGIILGGADVEARGHDHPIVPGLGVDVLDLLDALDDVLERLGDEFHRVLRPQAVGLDEDVHHRHRDLRLLFPRQQGEGHQTGGEGRDQEQRGERRTDEGPGEMTREAEGDFRKLGHAQRSGTTSRSPARRPARISIRPSRARPRWTTISSPLSRRT